MIKKNAQGGPADPIVDQPSELQPRPTAAHGSKRRAGRRGSNEPDGKTLPYGSLWEGLGSWEGLGEGISGVRERERERG